MLTSLSIKNFALIEKLNIDFSENFSIITGETGAGKSIVLGALGLILGKRADLSSLKNKEEKCVIEAHFEIARYQLEPFFEANDLDFENQTIIRREILPSGKSRAFVNDSPINLQELQSLGEYLIDIHSQHQTQELSEETFQFAIIDSIGNNQKILLDYQQLLKEYKIQKSNLATLKTKLQDASKEQDYNSFLLEELLSAKLKAGEQEELEILFEQLNNVEFIKESIDKSLSISEEEQMGVLQNLKEIKFSLQKIASFSPEYSNLLDRVTSVTIEFDDIVSEMKQLSEGLLSDPEQLELTNQKLQLIYTLQKKHQVTTIEELLAVQEALDTKVVSADSLQLEIEKIEQAISKNEKELDVLATSIHKNRIQAIPVLSEKLITILDLLGMPNVRFKIGVTMGTNYHANGKDELEFLFAANKGSDFGLLKKTASGGELSRIMLAVKSILAQYQKLPTIIFDEIDTGVSGEIAHKMGEIMKDMSKTMQVFAITHLPQIAAKGNFHFKVSKSTIGEQTLSELKLLSKEDRILEIAQMLSGKDISESALNHAKALLN